MVTDHEMRMEALRLFEENISLLERLELATACIDQGSDALLKLIKAEEILSAIDHTLTVHGHMDAFTPLHERLRQSLALSSHQGKSP
jgi:hypothetical protein